MKQSKKLIVIAIILAVIISGTVIGLKISHNNKINYYTDYFAGKTYEGLDSKDLQGNKGKNFYEYSITFNSDSTCTMKFKYTHTGDHSMWGENKTERAEFTDLTWDVTYVNNSYYVNIRGSKDWPNTSSALNVDCKISDFNGKVSFTGIRSGYYDVYFSSK